MKNLFSHLLLFLFCGCILFSCSRRSSARIDLEIDGAGQRSLLFFEISSEHGSVFLDSLRPDKNGHLRFLFPDDDLRMYAIATRGNADLICLVPLPGEQIILKAHYDSLLRTAVLSEQNHPEKNCPSIALAEYQQQLEQAAKDLQAIWSEWMAQRYRTEDPDSLHAACKRRSDRIVDYVKQKATELCRQNTDNLIPVFIANKTLENRNIFDPATNRQDLTLLRTCAEEMNRKHPGNSHITRLLFNLARIESYRKQEELRTFEQNRAHPLYD